MTFFRLMDSYGYLKSGSRNLCDIEARRISLIAENELKLSLERIGLAGDLSYLKGHRHRAAAIGWARRRIARLKSEITYWRSAPVETVTICR